jgi:hypothetical protein
MKGGGESRATLSGLSSLPNREYRVFAVRNRLRLHEDPHARIVH